MVKCKVRPYLVHQCECKEDLVQMMVQKDLLKDPKEEEKEDAMSASSNDPVLRCHCLERSLEIRFWSL